MGEPFRVRPFEPGDLPEVLEVMRLSLGESEVNQRTDELFAWKHLDNPFGRSVILVAQAGDRIAGLRAFMRWDLCTPEGHPVRCVRPVDTATHPDFRRMGIFRTLTTAAVDQCRHEGIDLVFNTPNPQSGAGYRKMGWRDVGPIGVMVRPKRIWAPRVSEGFDRARLIDGSVDPYPAEATDRPARGLRTPRTAEYRRWRFARHPTAGYRMVRAGDTVALLRPNVRNRRGEVVVSDVIGPRPAAGLRAAASAARSHYLATWFSPGSPERRAGTAAAYLPVPRVAALHQVALPLRELDRDVFDPRTWDLAVGDLELL